jgi:hypothetical protein
VKNGDQFPFLDIEKKDGLFFVNDIITSHWFQFQ